MATLFSECIFNVVWRSSFVDKLHKLKKKKKSVQGTLYFCLYFMQLITDQKEYTNMFPSGCRHSDGTTCNQVKTRWGVLSWTSHLNKRCPFCINHEILDNNDFSLLASWGIQSQWHKYSVMAKRQAYTFGNLGNLHQFRHVSGIIGEQPSTET